MFSPNHPSVRRGTLAVSLLLACLTAGPAAAAPTPMVDLGTASTYAVLSGAAMGNTPGTPETKIRGDLGVKAGALTGFPPGTVTGSKQIATPAAVQAHTDASAAYAEIAARTGGAPLNGALAGATISPGLHSVVGAVSNTGTVTLNAGGDPDAVFVIQVSAALDMAAGSHVVLAGGARASRVFWQANGAGSVGANADFAGTLLAKDAVGVGAATVFNGRAFALGGAMSLNTNQFYGSPPAVTIAGGASAITTDTTPTISGTTDVEAPGTVTVKVAGQTLTATPVDGAWSVTSAILANATYPVVASVVDGAQNPGSATQQLTVDTELPVISIDGGASVITNDATPTISGASDVAPGTTVRVAVGDQLLTALVQSGGGWNVTPTALSDGSRTFSASVTDPAGNQGTDSQELIVDTVAPAVTIAGGTEALTNDASPAISGTADVPAGATVTVTLADRTLTGQVQDGGAWTVISEGLSDGPHKVTMAATDAAGNGAGAVQALTIDTVAPAVTIDGGQTATTTNGAPTITGTSDAAPGSVVTVTIADRTMRTLLQADGTFNSTPSSVGSGTWSVEASVPDPAGNVGRAQQRLTTAPGTAPPAATPAPTPKPQTPATQTAVVLDPVQTVTPGSLSVTTKVTAPAGGKVTATATGVIRIKGVKRAFPLKHMTAKISAGNTATFKLKLKGSKAAKRAALKRINAAIRAQKKVTAALVVEVVDAAGNRKTVNKTVKLTRV